MISIFLSIFSPKVKDMRPNAPIIINRIPTIAGMKYKNFFKIFIINLL